MKSIKPRSLKKKKTNKAKWILKSNINASTHDINQTCVHKSSRNLLNNLQVLISLFPNLPNITTGRPRHLKVEPHYREPTSRLWLSPQTYSKTSKIRLTGNWIEKAGFICHERIRVIPMHRMLIIVPEPGCTDKHESETNEHE